MRFLFYTHSLISDWNHGNAHFLRGVMRELLALGHHARALEPEDSWSRQNLLADGGPQAVADFHATFPMLQSQIYGADFDHAAAVEGPMWWWSTNGQTPPWSSASAICAARAAASPRCSTTPTTAPSAARERSRAWTCRVTTASWPSAKRCANAI
ncbi:hypothetical protein ACFP76_19705 [Paracoccus aerius]|uniref:hypothetical protein n=1 Tax=Paracoccus aerius TaxID=1915382 RepID=UPI0036136A06